MKYKKFEEAALEGALQESKERCMDAYFAMKDAEKRGDEEELKNIVREWCIQSFNWDRAEDELEAYIRLLRKPEEPKERVDLDLLRWLAKTITEEYDRKGLDAGMPAPPVYEDFGADNYITAYTKERKFVATPYEIKSMRDRFTESGEDYYRTVAGRNRLCRYGLTAGTPTQEEIKEDNTEKPEWAESDTPIHVVNASTRNGLREGSKIDKILKGRWGLIYVRRGEILLFSPRDVEKAILGYFWIWVTPTEDFNDGLPPHWELKAAIDISKFTSRIECEVPEKFVKAKDDKPTDC